MSDKGAGQRVIGIRHTLRQLKNAGLVEKDSLHPQQAVKDVQGEMLFVAERWYEIGAKRGARKILEAFLDGHFEVRTGKNGNCEIIANKDSITWTKRLNVTVGNKKQVVGQRTYELTLQDLEFEV